MGESSEDYDEILDGLEREFPHLGERSVKNKELSESNDEDYFMFDELRAEHLEVLEDLRSIQREVRYFHLKKLDELMGRYEEVFESHEDIEDLKQESLDILDDHIDLLEEQANREQRKFTSRLGGGLISLIGGLGLAEFYSPTEGIIDFYYQTPEIVAESPETAALGVGLPILGLYSLSQSYSRKKRESELQAELSEYRARLRRIEDTY